MLKPDIAGPLDSTNPLPQMSFYAEMVFESEPPRAAFAYWDKIRAGRSMPARTDLRPQDMRSFITNVALIGVIETRDRGHHYPVQLMGSHIEQIFGTAAERSSTELPEEIKKRQRLIFDHVLASKKPVRVRSRVAFKSRLWIDAEAFVAPLGVGDTPSCLFGAFAIVNQS